MKSRIAAGFESESAFIARAQQFIRAFAYESTLIADGSIVTRVPTYTYAATVERKRWRPFQTVRDPALGYEPSAVAMMAFILQSLDIRTMFDIGASNGIYACTAAGFPSRNIRAHAFEMRPDRYQRMKREIERNELGDRVIPHLCGMSDKHEGERDIWFSRMRLYESEPKPSEYREGWWRRLKFALRGITNRDALIKAKMLVTSIDAFAANEGVNPDFLKIDVEGYEAKVLS